MHFYKTRNFGELISDTFTFVRNYGKNYFKHFVLMNGGVVLLLILVIALGYGELIEQMFGSNINGKQFYFEEYFAENQGIFIVVTLLVIALSVLLSLLTYSYPVLYMKRLANDSSVVVTSDMILQDLKKIWKKFLIYFLATLFIVMPIAFLLLMVSLFLTVLVIGFFFLILLIPLIMNIMNLTLFEYYNSHHGFFKSLRFALKVQFSKDFFKYVGSVFIIYIVINVLTSILTAIPFVILMSGAYVIPFDESTDTDTRILVLMTIFYGIYIVFSILVSNLIYINAGFMYYDAKKEFHKEVQMLEIESLGKNQ